MKVSFRERDPIRIGIASLAVLSLLFGLAFSINLVPLFAGKFELKAEFADAAGLAPGNEVRIAGLKVGSVKDVRLAGDRVIVTMKIEDEIRVPGDATAEILLSTILGTKFVGLDATGRGPQIADGATIPLARTKVPFEIYQTANRTVDLLTDIDGKKLNDGFRALADIAYDPDRNLARTLEGASELSGAVASQSEALDSLLSKGSELLATLDASSPEITQIIDDSDKLLEVVARRRGTVKSLLRNTELLAGSLGGLLKDDRKQIDSILRDLHAALIVVDRNLVEVEKALRLLGPSTESLSRIVWTGPWANICVVSIDWVNGERQGIGIGDPSGPNGPQGCDQTP